MSNVRDDTTNQKPAPREPVRQSKIHDTSEGIRVRELRFCRPTGLEIPVATGGMGGNHEQVNSIAAGKKKQGGGEFEIVFLPWMRHHRVAFKMDGKLVKVFFIPESWAIWEAAE
jgi:hypothetical protein